MNRIPDSFDLSEIVGDVLSQICIDQHQIQLKFERVSIQGGGDLLLESSGISKQLFSDSWVSTCGLEDLIGCKVIGWEKRDDFHFCLSFACDANLVFVTQERPFEDFTIHIWETEFYVL